MTTQIPYQDPTHPVETRAHDLLARMTLPESVTNAAAIVELFNPGMCGGHAAAEAIFGRVNPSGKLTISIPRHVGQ